MVTSLAIYSGNLGLNPARAYSFFGKIVVERTKKNK